MMFFILKLKRFFMEVSFVSILVNYLIIRLLVFDFK